MWQIAIATSAPEDGPFFGHVPNYTDLPIYMGFNSGYGYLSGAGWPNHLATLVALALACAVFVTVLYTDANRPVFARSTASSVRSEQELTARLLTFVLLGGLITTLGAVWMHTGASGQALVGLDEQWASGDQSHPRVYVAGGYDAIARTMNLVGYAFQAGGVAFLLRSHRALQQHRALQTKSTQYFAGRYAPDNSEMANDCRPCAKPPEISVSRKPPPRRRTGRWNATDSS